MSEDRDKTATKGVLPFGLVGFAVAFGLWSIWSTSAGPDVNAARRLVGNLEADGSIHNRACGPSRPNRASISRARWELWNLERQEDVMNALATICDAEGAGMEVQLLDLETGAVLALFDGSSVGSESAVEPHDHD